MSNRSGCGVGGKRNDKPSQRDLSSKGFRSKGLTWGRLKVHHQSKSSGISTPVTGVGVVGGTGIGVGGTSDWEVESQSIPPDRPPQPSSTPAVAPTSSLVRPTTDPLLNAIGMSVIQNWNEWLRDCTTRATSSVIGEVTPSVVDVNATKRTGTVNTSRQAVSREKREVGSVGERKERPRISSLFSTRLF